MTSLFSQNDLNHTFEEEDPLKQYMKIENIHVIYECICQSSEKILQDQLLNHIIRYYNSNNLEVFKKIFTLPHFVDPIYLFNMLIIRDQDSFHKTMKQIQFYQTNMIVIESVDLFNTFFLSLILESIKDFFIRIMDTQVSYRFFQQIKNHFYLSLSLSFHHLPSFSKTSSILGRVQSPPLLLSLVLDRQGV